MINLVNLQIKRIYFLNKNAKKIEKEREVVIIDNSFLRVFGFFLKKKKNFSCHL